MKNKFFLFIILLMLLISLTALYFVDIPAPSTIVIEDYKMDLK